jgi:putative tryptophan/tyrosine transport system substrate-binding protein
MRRRDIIGLLGGAAIAMPRIARAQPLPIPLVGFVAGTSADEYNPMTAAFQRGLNERGYVVDRTVRLEYLWAEGRYDRLPALMSDLVARRPAVIAAAGNSAALAAKAATTTIPIVFTCGDDPIGIGLVASLNRPGANLTGVSFFATALIAKRLELMRELLGEGAVVAVLINPDNPTMGRAIERIAATGQQLAVLQAKSEADIDAAFASMPQRGVRGLIVTADPFFTGRRHQIIALAAHHAVPTVYEWREFVAAGGLMSYGSVLTDGYRLQGVFAGQILDGAKPADLPVIQPAKFELVLNLKTARSLGLAVPRLVRVRADEVID